MNIFDQFDSGSGGANVFDQFDASKAPQDAQHRLKLGADAFPDFLRQEMRNADPITRNLASAGTALTDLWERGKQLVGQGDQQAIEANRIMAQEAPVGAVLGQGALAAIPFGLVGNTAKAATAVGAGLGFAKPVAGEQTFDNIARGTVANTLLDAAFGGLGQGVANRAGEFFAKKAQDLSTLRSQRAPIDKTINDAIGAGYVIPPTSVEPTTLNAIKESIAGKTATAQAAATKNEGVTNSLIRQDLGLAEDAPLTSDTMRAIRERAYNEGYKPIIDTPAIPADEGLINSLINLSPKNAGGAVKNPAQPAIDDLVDSLANKGVWTGPQLVRDIQALREQANANFVAAAREGGNVASRDLARAQASAANALEAMGARRISPDAIQGLRDARTMIAKAHTAEDAIVQGGGTADARVFARRAQNEKPMSDIQSVIGNFANNFPRAAQPAKQIAGPGISKLDWAMALGGGGIGAMADGHEGGILGTLAPLVASRAMRAQVLSRGRQNALADMVKRYQLSLPARATNSLLQYAPVGGTVLGLEAFPQ